MSEWQDRSDFEINKAVAEFKGFGLDNGYGFVDSDGNLVCYDVIRKTGEEPLEIEVRVNYCNDPSDAWLIILSNRININAYDTCEHWFATTDTSFFIDDKNPLRAAMIVYLEMNGVKP